MSVCSTGTVNETERSRNETWGMKQAGLEQEVQYHPSYFTITILAYLLLVLSTSVTNWDCSSNIRSKLRSLWQRVDTKHQLTTRPDKPYSSVYLPLGGNSYVFFPAIIFGRLRRLSAQLLRDVRILLLKPLHLNLEETRTTLFVIPSKPSVPYYSCAHSWRAYSHVSSAM